MDVTRRQAACIVGAMATNVPILFETVARMENMEFLYDKYIVSMIRTATVDFARQLAPENRALDVKACVQILDLAAKYVNNLAALKVCTPELRDDAIGYLTTTRYFFKPVKDTEKST